MRKLTLLPTLFLLLALGSAIAPAEAGDASRWSGPLRMADNRLSQDAAVEMAQRRYHARAVRVETKRDGDRTLYRIRLLSPEGRVFTVTVNANSGEIRE
jgi:uncharacterized membrane protein YkoI